MITDAETNVVYIADQLPIKQHSFYKQFTDALTRHKTSYRLLHGTKDIWAVDYMPIQVTRSQFVQFIYNPDYLQSKKWLKTITDVDSVCRHVGITTRKTDIVLDGGNVIRSKTKIILCDKVLCENPHYTTNGLTDALQQLFKINQVVFIPQQPEDIIGHADGMVRFVNDDTVVINDYSKENIQFRKGFDKALHKAGLTAIPIAYNPYQNKKDIQANGYYINYLQLNGIIFLPIFNLKDDEIAVRQFEQIFPGVTIVPVICNDVANDGGVLNCISWNIAAN